MNSKSFCLRFLISLIKSEKLKFVIFSNFFLSSLEINSFINFKNFLKFNKNVSVRENMDDLTFIKNKEKYGLYFQGGICKIDQTSYSYILNKAL